MKKTISKSGQDAAPLRRVIHPEIRVLDAKQGIVEYVASDESIDSYLEVVRADGWQFNLFSKNAPFVDSHDYSTIKNLVGRVLDYTVTGGKLVETVKWAIDVPENELAQIGFNMTAGGYLKAVSVGFFPKAAVSCYDSNTNAFTSLCATMNLDPTKVRTIYTRQEQIELSACIIGANPNALAKALKDGAVSQDQVFRLLQEPGETRRANPAAPMVRSGEAVRARARRWFLEEMNRA
jgi:hypothetical protein